MAAAKDEVDRAMRHGGRKIWNRDDYNLMVKTFDRLFPEPAGRKAGASG